jgi:hypothetical protein
LIANKLRHDGGALARLTRGIADDRKLTEELYMVFLCRPPTEKELATVAGYVRNQASEKRRQAFEDIAWALLNSKEFLFNH